MGRATERRETTAGLSLVELLVVLGMIGVISAVVVPVYIRSGWSPAGKSAFAARELFTILKAARVYASTYNVETAVAYGGTLLRDSELVDNPCVPAADSVILARRLKRDELIGYGLGANSTNIFVPLKSADGVFRTLPKQMAVLPDLFEVETLPSSTDLVSSTGMSSIQLYDTDAFTFFGPRSRPVPEPCVPAPPLPVMDYALDGLDLSFPAHRFLPDGSLRTPENLPTQRFRFRVGARPDAPYKDRFFTSSEAPDAIVPGSMTVVFNAFDTNNNSLPATVGTNMFDNDTPSDFSDDYGAEVSTTIELFAPTGRVKLAP